MDIFEPTNFTEFFFIGDFLKILFAAFLGVLIGLERELSGKDPPLRTFSLIALGACVFSLVSREIGPNADHSRIASQIVTGIGFIGAGTIFRSREKVVGLTTAALMWTTASIGMAVAFDRIALAVSTVIVVLCITLLLRYVHRILDYVQGQETKENDT